MSRPHVLISSTYYWPEATGNAPYVTGLAEHLAGNGYQVTVVTGFPHYPAWKSTSGRKPGASEERGGVDIQRRWHYVPGSATTSRRALYEMSIAATGWTALRPRLKPDVVLAVVPTLAAGMLGSVASKAYRAPLGLILQDLMGPAATQNGVRAGKWLTNSLSNAEIAMARRADAVGVITEGFRPYLEERGVRPDRIAPVRNWSQPAPCSSEERGVTRARLGWAEDEFICLHSGNMGQKQGLDNLLAAAAGLQELGERRIRIVLAGDGNDRQRLQQEARRLQLRNLSFVGFQADGQYSAMLKAADLLVVHQRASLTNSALPSKLTSYFQSGGAVLAVAAAESQAAIEVDRSGGGIVMPPGEPRQLACKLIHLSHDRAELRRLGDNARQYATTHLGPGAALAEYERLVVRLLENNR